MDDASVPQLRALFRAQPGELTRALLLDRLTERGDPRSVFAHAHAVGDQALVEALLARYAAHLKDPLPADADVDFSGGFVDAWRTDPNGFRRSGRRLLRALPLRSLTVVAARRVDVKYVLESWGLETVKELSFPRLASPVLFDALARPDSTGREVSVTSHVMTVELSSLPREWLATARKVPDRFLHHEVSGRVRLAGR